MFIRPAETKDLKDIIEITKLLYLKIPNFVWDDERFVVEHLEKGEYFLAEEEGKVVGVMSLRQRQNRMHIETLAVRDEFQSNGLGTTFIEFAKEFTKKKGLNVLHVYSFVEYDRKGFYLKKGFKMLDYSGYYNNHQFYCFEMNIA